jgi:hypothetical protein
MALLSQSGIEAGFTGISILFDVPPNVARLRAANTIGIVHQKLNPLPGRRYFSRRGCWSSCACLLGFDDGRRVTGEKGGGEQKRLRTAPFVWTI